METRMMADNDMEMVIVHVDDGTKLGHDRKFTRKDAEKFMAYTPNARIMGDEQPAEEPAPEMAPAAEPAAKAVERAPSNKAAAKAESK
jgi:hypothetical protein